MWRTEHHIIIPRAHRRRASPPGSKPAMPSEERGGASAAFLDSVKEDIDDDSDDDDDPMRSKSEYESDVSVRVRIVLDLDLLRALMHTNMFGMNMIMKGTNAVESAVQSVVARAQDAMGYLLQAIGIDSVDDPQQHAPSPAPADSRPNSASSWFLSSQS